MNDEIQQPVSEPKKENPEIEVIFESLAPKKSNKDLWILAGTVVAVLCLFSFVATVGNGFRELKVERAPLEATLDTLMKYMEAKDVESAFALFSWRAQRQMSITDLEELTEGNNYVEFEGYESISLQNLNLTVGANFFNPDIPQGTVADVTAIVSYTDGFTGNLTAVLEKVYDVWKVYSFGVVVPPDKFLPK